ncbi:alpha/beta hydrolase [Nocardia vinacea]|uniref:alpha/beta fold hydrolase n=1 Tax=Nocardia vinacea TaxID=96468 RepID=UPI0033D5CFA8
MTDRSGRIPRRTCRRPARRADQPVAHPVLVIHGRRDRLYPCAESIARYSAAGAQTAITESAGHTPHLECPTEVV